MYMVTERGIILRAINHAILGAHFIMIGHLQRWVFGMANQNIMMRPVLRELAPVGVVFIRSYNACCSICGAHYTLNLGNLLQRVILLANISY